MFGLSPILFPTINMLAAKMFDKTTQACRYTDLSVPSLVTCVIDITCRALGFILIKNMKKKPLSHNRFMVRSRGKGTGDPEPPPPPTPVKSQVAIYFP